MGEAKPLCYNTIMNLKNLQEKMKPFEKIYRIVSKIPKGKVMTYAQVAVLAGLSNPQIVGFAMAANKDTEKVPCHRVISSKGELTGYAFGGISKKKELLQKEGVLFLDSGRVNLKQSIYSTVSSSSTTSSPEL